MELKNKIVIVTGASSGIGKATAKLLDEKGAKVVVAARSTKKLQELAKQLHNALAITADMTNPADIRHMVKKTIDCFGRIDILVNNAGRGYDATVEELDMDKFRYIFSLDVVGPVLAMQEVIPYMRRQKEGAIVNISSGTALMALAGMGGYSSMKRALVGISLTAREELKNDHISVSVVYPYITATDFEKNTLKTLRKKDEEEGGNFELPPGDPPEFVAELILDAVKTGKAEIVAHDWIGKR